MKTLLPLFAGLVGTLCMTLFTEMAFSTVNKKYHVVRILGNMFAFRKFVPIESLPPPGSYTGAFVLHYVLGIMFSELYFWLSDQGLILMILAHNILYGIGIATVAILGWRIFFALHPSPPPVQLKYYLPIIWLGHIVLSTVLILLYQTYVPNEIGENISVCK